MKKVFSKFFTIVRNFVTLTCLYILIVHIVIRTKSLTAVSSNIVVHVMGITPSHLTILESRVETTILFAPDQYPKPQHGEVLLQFLYEDCNTLSLDGSASMVSNFVIPVSYITQPMWETLVSCHQVIYTPGKIDYGLPDMAVVKSKMGFDAMHEAFDMKHPTIFHLVGNGSHSHFAQFLKYPGDLHPLRQYAAQFLTGVRHANTHASTTSNALF